MDSPSVLGGRNHGSGAGAPGRSDRSPPARIRARSERRCARAISTMVPAVLVTAVSVIVASALLVAFLGYRPMVERSGSMVPRLRIGDVVLAEWVPADRIRPGEIVTFPLDIGRTELVTHRVQRVRLVGHEVRVVTKGDANVDPEHWSASRSTLVGRVVWTVPRVGALMTALGSAFVRRMLLAVSSLLIVICAVVAFARRRQEAARVGTKDTSRSSGPSDRGGSRCVRRSGGHPRPVLRYTARPSRYVVRRAVVRFATSWRRAVSYTRAPGGFVEIGDPGERMDALGPADLRLEHVADPGRDPLVQECRRQLGARFERCEASQHGVEVDSRLAQVGTEAFEHL